MKIRKYAAPLAALMGAALVLSSCSSADTPDEDVVTTEEPDADGGEAAPGNDDASVVTVGWNQALYSYNSNTDHGNAAANNVILYMTQSGFNYYDGDLVLTPDTSFGNYEVLSEDPLKVKYTIADTTTWSDGTPVDAADMLLGWAGISGNLNDEGEVETDEEGEVIVADDQVFFASGSPGLALVSEVPEIGDDNKSVTLTYDKPFADWESAFGIPVPAHSTAILAEMETEAQAGKDAVIKAIQDNDREALVKIANSYRNGFDFVSTPGDPLQALSSGPYVMTEFVENQFITLEKNDKYVGDHEGQIDRIVVRYSEDPQAQVQALQNGEIDMLAPQATADTLAQLEALEGITIMNAVDGTYEHVDYVQDNGGPFDPATYGGDAEKAKKVRQAFTLTIPRQQIVDQLIKPLNPEAETRDSFILLPDDPNYPRMVEENGSADLGEVDIERAKALLAEVGVDSVDVRLLYGASNVRRQNEYTLIAESAKEAGFNVIDGGDDNWGTMLSTEQDKYDIGLFGWQSTSTAVTESDANFRTGGANNYFGYSNKEVDALFDELQVETDPAKQIDIQIDVEKHLWEDAFGTTIYQFPGVNAWNSKIEGVEPIPIAPTIFASFWDWKIAG